MPGSAQARFILTFFMNVLFVVAVLLTGRIVVEFFGALAITVAGRAIVDFTEFLVLRVGISGARTPYGGVFDVGAALTVVVVLLIEWALSVARTRG
ncbi:MAG: hypothetical protein IBX63_01695 [Coriobacteriia bacterium]|nr:hypothetical protein [Coriobacteriia bacterium]